MDGISTGLIAWSISDQSFRGNSHRTDTTAPNLQHGASMWWHWGFSCGIEAMMTSIPAEMKANVTYCKVQVVQRTLGSPFQNKNAGPGRAWPQTQTVIIIHDILLYMTAPRSGTCTKTPQTPQIKAPQCLKTGLLLIPNTSMEASTGSQFIATNNPSREAEHWLMRQLIKEKAASSGPITACLEEEDKLIKHRPAVRFKITSYLHQGMSSWCPGA